MKIIFVAIFCSLVGLCFGGEFYLKLFKISDGRESAVNTTLDGNTYPG
jgi:hypothetical protein